VQANKLRIHEAPTAQTQSSRPNPGLRMAAVLGAIIILILIAG